MDLLQLFWQNSEKSTFSMETFQVRNIHVEIYLPKKLKSQWSARDLLEELRGTCKSLPVPYGIRTNSHEISKNLQLQKNNACSISHVIISKVSYEIVFVTSCASTTINFSLSFDGFYEKSVHTVHNTMTLYKRRSIFAVNNAWIWRKSH